MELGWKKDYARYKSFFLNTLNVYKQKPDVKIFLEVILSIVTITILSLFAIKPTIVTILELNKEIQNKEETLAIMKKKIKDLQTASNLLEKESSRMSIIMSAVPDNASPETFIKTVENQVSSNGVETLAFSASDVYVVGKEDKESKAKQSEPIYEGASEVPFTISVTAPYQNLVNFLKSMENLRRPVKFDAFAINSSIKDEGKIIVMVISGRIPYLYEER